jgi:hypothetical protein
MKAIINQSADVVACVQALESGPENGVSLTYCNLTLRPLSLAVAPGQGSSSSEDAVAVSLFGEDFLGSGTAYADEQRGGKLRTNARNNFLRTAKNLWLKTISEQLPVGGEQF